MAFAMAHALVCTLGWIPPCFNDEISNAGASLSKIGLIWKCVRVRVLVLVLCCVRERVYVVRTSWGFGLYLGRLSRLGCVVLLAAFLFALQLLRKQSLATATKEPWKVHG